MRENMPTFAVLLEYQHIRDSAFRTGRLPQRNNVTIFFAVARKEHSRAEVASKCVETVSFWDVKGFFLPVGVHILHSDSCIFCQNLINITAGQPMTRHRHFLNGEKMIIIAASPVKFFLYKAEFVLVA